MSEANGVQPNIPDNLKSLPLCITGEDIDFEIEHAKKVQYYVFPDTTVTCCCVELRNGFCVIGTAVPVSASNFNEDIGRRVAMDKVRDKMWELLGYDLKNTIHLQAGV